MSREASWDDVFGDLDMRVLDHSQRLDWINDRIHRTLRGKNWAALSAGDEGQLAWDAALRTFVEGIWVASIFCCHVVCEREVAGVLTASDARINGELPKSWERRGLGGLLTLVRQHYVLPLDLIDEVQRVAEVRRPYGHWRSTIDEESLRTRVRAEHELTGNTDFANLVQRLGVRDATQSMETTIKLYFCSYGLGGP